MALGWFQWTLLTLWTHTKPQDTSVSLLCIQQTKPSRAYWNKCVEGWVSCYHRYNNYLTVYLQWLDDSVDVSSPCLLKLTKIKAQGLSLTPVWIFFLQSMKRHETFSKTLRESVCSKSFPQAQVSPWQRANKEQNSVLLRGQTGDTWYWRRWVRWCSITSATSRCQWLQQINNYRLLESDNRNWNPPVHTLTPGDSRWASTLVSWFIVVAAGLFSPEMKLCLSQ